MLEDKDLPPYLYGDLKREELVRTGSVVLHEHYFGNLGGDGKASGSGARPIKGRSAARNLGGRVPAHRERARRRLGLGRARAATCTPARPTTTGPGITCTAPCSGAPLLVLDMYEHAYHMDFGAAAARYVDAFFENVNWEEVSRRAEWARKASALEAGRPA